jgi:hypothetical protein
MTIMDRMGLPRAADYPFQAPLERYVFTAGGKAPPFEVEGRTPVLALASNASPEQLYRKFEGRAGTSR